MPEAMWFIRDRGQVRGPFSHDQLLQLHKRGQLARFVEVSEDRLNWIKSAEFLDRNGTTSGVGSGSPDYSRRSAAPPAATVHQPAPAYEYPWPVIPENSGFAGDPPRSKPSNKLKWAAILAVPMVLIAMTMVIVTYFLVLKKERNNSSLLAFDHSIKSTFDQDEIAASVGLVIVGFEFKRPNGEHGEKPLMTGSCFAVTEDGSVLTNRHVVEFFDQMENATALDQRLQLYIGLWLSQQPAANREKAVQDIKANPDEFRFSVIEPKIWVFFTGSNGRPEKKTAKLTYLSDASEYDFAILKLDRARGQTRTGPYFRLANSEKKLRRGDPVVALGFPGTTRIAVSPDEQVEELVRRKLASRIESIYKDRDFEYVRTAGEVSLDFIQKSGRRWIQHNAAITHGNSGGPLVNPKGLVVGINTQGAQDGSTFQALSIVQLKEIIQDKVPEVVFSNQ